MGGENTLDEERGVSVDCATEAEGGFNPVS